jgi:alanyl-tRNA synthetase
MNTEVRTHTALHILKGAVYKVLGAKWTTGVSVNDNHGRLVVEQDHKPTEDEIGEIERLTNMKISEDSQVEVYQMKRDAAEEQWGDFIYDKFPLPDHIREIQVFHLPEWNVNACNKEHTETTGQIGKLIISKTRYRNSKNLLEISFDIED